ncbi:uncharacterized protein METZ01_LOCUS512850 [marine metagenome]|uniref:Adhesin n=1 Tax=marine metagenome TaxID=408172 RepID=A0A383ESW0_9ZZZZ
MIAGIYNITCEQGTDFTRSCILKYPDANDPTGSTYLLYDLTGYTARMQIRRTLESATPEIELTTENSGIVLGGDAGTFEIVMTNAQTSALDSDGVYDLEIISGGGTVSRVIQGTFTLDLEVTH